MAEMYVCMCVYSHIKRKDSGNREGNWDNGKDVPVIRSYIQVESQIFANNFDVAARQCAS